MTSFKVLLLLACSEEGICAMASLYSTKAAASSAPHGSIRSEDGLLDLKIARTCVLTPLLSCEL